MRHLWWLLAALLVCVGVALALSGSPAPADFGWLASTPATVDRPWGSGSGSVWVLLSGGQVAGAALAVLGLLVLAAGAGFRAGRRRTS